MIKKITSFIPNTITSLNLLSGCMAVICTFNLSEPMFGTALTGTAWCYIFIALAAMFDFCDGFSARLLHAYSPMGKELDSLSDLVSFGVAPGMLMLNTIGALSTASWVPFAALLIPMCGALRLAKFNIDDSQATSFAGLPIPANAIFWIGLSDWMAQYSFPGNTFIIVTILLISLAMVSRFRMFSLKFKNLDIRENFRRYIIILAAALFVWSQGIAGLAWTIILYIIISLAVRNRD